MKSRGMYGSLFWGGLVIFLGISIILGSVAKIKVPFFEISLAAIFIYIGVSMILGNCCSKDKKKKGE